MNHVARMRRSALQHEREELAYRRRTAAQISCSIAQREYNMFERERLIDAIDTCAAMAPSGKGDNSKADIDHAAKGVYSVKIERLDPLALPGSSPTGTYIRCRALDGTYVVASVVTGDRTESLKQMVKALERKLDILERQRH